jgi:hypothetical protein
MGGKLLVIGIFWTFLHTGLGWKRHALISWSATPGCQSRADRGASII